MSPRDSETKAFFMSGEDGGRNYDVAVLLLLGGRGRGGLPRLRRLPKSDPR
jgi:hypothetical protein